MRVARGKKILFKRKEKLSGCVKNQTTKVTYIHVKQQIRAYTLIYLVAGELKYWKVVQYQGLLIFEIRKPKLNQKTSVFDKSCIFMQDKFGTNLLAD